MRAITMRKIAILSVAFAIGIVALGQIMHDDAEALGLCSASCKCVRCGWAENPTRACWGLMTYCAGMGLVRNCGSYCGIK